MVKIYPEGLRSFSCPVDAAYDTQTISLTGAEGGPWSVLISDTSWPVIVVTKCELTQPAFDPVKLLYVRVSHIALSTMRSVVCT